MTRLTITEATPVCGCQSCSPHPRPAGWANRARSRRGVLTAGLGVAVAGMAPAVGSAAPAAGPKVDPAEALRRLMTGNARFISGKLESFDEDLEELRRGTVGKQEPFAAVLSCADSRVPVELVFDQSIGRLFVARVAGNIASTDIIASLEYGAAVLGVGTIVVLAHEGCGAVKAAIAGGAVPGQISALYAPLRAAVLQGGTDPEQVARANAKIQADILANASPLLGGLIKDGALSVVPAYYSLSTGKVDLLR